MSSKSNRANLHLLNIGCYNIANKQCVIHETPNPQSMPVDWGFFGVLVSPSEINLYLTNI